MDLDDRFFNLNNAQKLSEIVEYEGKYYAVGVRCSSGYREYKSNIDDYVNDVLCFVFIYIGEINNGNKIKYKVKDKFALSSKKSLTKNSVDLATFYLGNKFLAVEAKNVISSIGIDKLEESIDMDKNNHFKGMVLYKENLISVLDIRKFINEDITDDGLENIILLQYDEDNIEHCVGILVSSLENISVVEKSSIQHIQSHFLGSGTLIQSLVDIEEEGSSKVAMILDIEKIDDNLTQELS